MFCSTEPTIVREEKFYSKIDIFLPEINEKVIMIDKEEKKKFVELTKDILHLLISEMKDIDAVFKYFFNRISYVGSFYDGLRVGHATEFDLNIVLNIPCHYEKIEIENSNVRSGFVRVNVKNAINDRELNKLPNPNIWKKWIDKDGYLLSDRILSWWQSVLSKFRSGMDIWIRGFPYKITFRRSGPAFTLNIRNDKLMTNIDVDLVVVIEFPMYKKPPSPIRWIDSQKPWCVVPKQPFKQYDTTTWRVSFPEQEKQLIRDKYHLKYVNRLLKKFAAKQLNVPSYYIKTLFLWEELEQRHIYRFWNQRPGYLFVYMLEKLQKAIQKRILKFYWHKKLNLFEYLEQSNAENMFGYINRIILTINKSIENNGDDDLKMLLYQIFDVPETTTTNNQTCSIL